MMRYYVVIGENAVMVSSSYDRAQYCCATYFRGHRWVKRFDSFYTAQGYGLAHLHTIAPFQVCPAFLRLNQVVTVRSLPFKPVAPIIWSRHWSEAVI